MSEEHPLSRLMSTQVSLLLIKEIKEGVFAAAERLPPEVELSEQLGVSRTVIRDALSNIEREGYIERTRGVGTVINHRIVNLETRLDLKQEYNELVVNSSYPSNTDSVQLRLETASEELAEKLNIAPGAKIIACEKRVLAGKNPVIYSFDYLPMSLLKDVNYETIDWSRSIFDILKDYCGIRVTSDITKVTATNADTYIRSKLNVQAGEALNLLDEISFEKPNQPVLRSLEFYTDFFDFSMLRQRF